MTRAVLDTNTIISGLIVPGSIPDRLLRAVAALRFEMITSAAIVGEVVHTLQRDRVRRRYHITPEEVARVRHLLEHDAILVAITEDARGVASHPEDDFILATAVSGAADYLVTGDRQLQRLGAYRGVTIVSPRSFWELVVRDPW